MIEERWLVRDDKVLPFGRGALKNVHSGHHRDSDSGDLRIRVSPALDRVHSIRTPFEAYILLDAFNDFICRDSLFLLRKSRERAKQKCEKQRSTLHRAP